MAYQSFEEEVKDYDKRRDMHYYVYFSAATYTYKVDVIQFKKKSDIKNDRYKNEKYYSTYKAAKRAADRITEDDKNVAHLFGRAARDYTDKLREALKTEGITATQTCTIEAAIANTNALTKLLNGKFY